MFESSGPRPQHLPDRVRGDADLVTYVLWRALPGCQSAKALVSSRTFHQMLLKSSLLSQNTCAVKNPSWLAWSATMLAKEVFPTPRSRR